MDPAALEDSDASDVAADAGCSEAETVLGSSSGKPLVLLTGRRRAAQSSPRSHFAKVQLLV